MEEVETDGKEGASVETKVADGDVKDSEGSEGSEGSDDTKDSESRLLEAFALLCSSSYAAILRFMIAMRRREMKGASTVQTSRPSDNWTSCGTGQRSGFGMLDVQELDTTVEHGGCEALVRSLPVNLFLLLIL